MASYDTKFSLNDTAYLVDTAALNVVPATVTCVYLNHAAGQADPSIAYGVAFYNTTGIIRKTKYDESDLMYLEEAKSAVVDLLNQRTSDIESLK